MKKKRSSGVTLRSTEPARTGDPWPRNQAADPTPQAAVHGADDSGAATQASRAAATTAAHDTAVGAVIDHLQAHAATTRVRTKTGRDYPDTGGLIVATFRQHTSRADDPQIHTHAFISSKVQTADGGWWELDARYLKRYQRALGGLY